MTIYVAPSEDRAAVLDDAHIGHINGAFGTILHGDVAPRETWKHRLITLMAILGPGLIVMVGDNDAGAFATYGQAGQNYGTTLLWTLALLIPVLYVNQEMVLRLGAVTGVGHARLIFERFGKFWGAFSVIDLFMLNALTIVTEFIGISLALDYLGLDKTTGVIVSAALVMLAVSTGNPGTSGALSVSPWFSSARAFCSSRSISWPIRRSLKWRGIFSFRECRRAAN